MMNGNGFWDAILQRQRAQQMAGLPGNPRAAMAAQRMLPRPGGGPSMMAPGTQPAPRPQGFALAPRQFDSGGGGMAGMRARDLETYQGAPSPPRAAPLQRPGMSPAAPAAAAGPSFGDRINRFGNALATQGQGMLMSDERTKTSELDSLRRRYAAMGGGRRA